VGPTDGLSVLEKSILPFWDPNPVQPNAWPSRYIDSTNPAPPEFVGAQVRRATHWLQVVTAKFRHIPNTFGCTRWHGGLTVRSAAPQRDDTPDRCAFVALLTARITPLAYQRQARPVATLRQHSTCHINRCLLLHTSQQHNAKHSYATGTNEFRNVASLPSPYTRYSVSRSEWKHRLNTAPCHKWPLEETQDPNPENETEVWRGLCDLELRMYRTG